MINDQIMLASEIDLVKLTKMLNDIYDFWIHVGIKMKIQKSEWKKICIESEKKL